MPDAEDLEKTLPNSPAGEAKAQDLDKTQKVTIKPKKSGRTRWILGSIAVFLVVAGLGALGGMQAGVFAREQEGRMQSAVEAYTQFQLGITDLQNGQCDIARQRFTYVIELDPTYPDIVNYLVQAQMCTGITAEPNAQLTAGPTPTPDTRAAELIFADAQSLLISQNWEQLLITLDNLRNNNPDFQPIEVDRMYYIALRHRGGDKIVAGDLEGGIFDLNRAEQIGPLDVDAQNLRQWASWYIIGASFWEIDWPHAVEYFSLLVQAAPNLHDLSFFTAQDRLATAVSFEGGDLVDQARELADDELWCSADSTMTEAAQQRELTPEEQELAVFYAEQCAAFGDVEQ
jgi:tetratricopeptide (TPR) repeat protein